MPEMKKATPIGEEDNGIITCSVTLNSKLKTLEALFPVGKLGFLGFNREESEDEDEAKIAWAFGQFSTPLETLTDVVRDNKKYVNLVNLLINIYEAGVAEGKSQKSNELRRICGLSLYPSNKAKRKLRKERK